MNFYDDLVEAFNTASNTSLLPNDPQGLAAFGLFVVKRSSLYAHDDSNESIRFRPEADGAIFSTPRSAGLHSSMYNECRANKTPNENENENKDENAEEDDPDQNHLPVTRTAAAKQRSRAKSDSEREMISQFNQLIRKLLSRYKKYKKGTKDAKDSKALSRTWKRCQVSADELTQRIKVAKFRIKGPGRRYHMGAGFFHNLPFEFFSTTEFLFLRDDTSSKEKVWKKSFETLAECYALACKWPKVGDIERKNWQDRNEWGYVRMYWESE